MNIHHGNSEWPKHSQNISSAQLKNYLVSNAGDALRVVDVFPTLREIYLEPLDNLSHEIWKSETGVWIAELPGVLREGAGHDQIEYCAKQEKNEVMALVFLVEFYKILRARSSSAGIETDEEVLGVVVHLFDKDVTERRYQKVIEQVVSHLCRMENVSSLEEAIPGLTDLISEGADSILHNRSHHLPVDRNRRRKGERIQRNPKLYSACYGCGSLIASKLSACPNCHSYRLERRGHIIPTAVRLIMSKQRESVIPEDLS